VGGFRPRNQPRRSGPAPPGTLSVHPRHRCGHCSGAHPCHPAGQAVQSRNHRANRSESSQRSARCRRRWARAEQRCSESAESLHFFNHGLSGLTRIKYRTSSGRHSEPCEESIIIGVMARADGFFAWLRVTGDGYGSVFIRAIRGQPLRSFQFRIGTGTVNRSAHFWASE
jgi:hypothetical protein